MTRALALLSLLATSCYEPKLRDCAVRCAADDDCGPGQACGADGWCATPSALDQCAGVIGGTLLDAADDPSQDATVMIDGALPPPGPDASTPPPTTPDASTPPTMPDASPPPPPPPPSGCAADCAGTCQAGVCVIDCTTSGSCANGVTCPQTGACYVRCSGNKSCEGRVRCGSGPCEVECSGNMSCEHGVRCEDACACDVTCSGNMACDGEVRCPSDACETANGCTSAPGVCRGC